MPGLRFARYGENSLEVIYDDDTLGYIEKIEPNNWRLLYFDGGDQFLTPQQAAQWLIDYYGYV